MSPKIEVDGYTMSVESNLEYSVDMTGLILSFSDPVAAAQLRKLIERFPHQSEYDVVITSDRRGSTMNGGRRLAVGSQVGYSATKLSIEG